MDSSAAVEAARNDVLAIFGVLTEGTDYEEAEALGHIHATLARFAAACTADARALADQLAVWLDVFVGQAHCLRNSKANCDAFPEQESCFVCAAEASVAAYNESRAQREVAE